VLNPLNGQATKNNQHTMCVCEERETKAASVPQFWPALTSQPVFYERAINPKGLKLDP
jgi:hypothetical protein